MAEKNLLYLHLQLHLANLDESLIAELATMPVSLMLGARVEREWVEQVNAIANATGRRPADVVREALAAYLGRTDPGAVKDAIASLEDRVAKLEQKLARGRLAD
jgi:RHH-type rel operon transcriptional repressor/antitoxin RelB